MGLGVVAALVAIFVLLFDWNWLRGPVERAVSAKTGRDFHLGHLEVDLGRITTVRGERLSLGNASWSKRGAMAELNAAEIDVEFLAAAARQAAVAGAPAGAPHAVAGSR